MLLQLSSILEQKSLSKLLISVFTELLYKYKKLNENLNHVDFIPAPYYLCITRLAIIGILTYNPMLHNTAYCAPNKIFEYGAFSVPMIGNNIPGLNILKEHRAGILVNEDDM